MENESIHEWGPFSPMEIFVNMNLVVLIGNTNLTWEQQELHDHSKIFMYKYIYIKFKFTKKAVGLAQQKNECENN